MTKDSENERVLFDVTDRYFEPSLSFSSSRVAITDKDGQAIFN
jgi:hypothetical protein